MAIDYFKISKDMLEKCHEYVAHKYPSFPPLYPKGILDTKTMTLSLGNLKINVKYGGWVKLEAFYAGWYLGNLFPPKDDLLRSLWEIGCFDENFMNFREFFDNEKIRQRGYWLDSDAIIVLTTTLENLHIAIIQNRPL